MNASELATIKDAVAPIAARYGVERMFLFGSRARGDNRPDSDYDFLIYSGRIRGLWKFIGFWTELEEAFHSYVDVITEDASDQDLLREARKDSVLVYENKG